MVVVLVVLAFFFTFSNSLPPIKPYNPTSFVPSQWPSPLPPFVYQLSTSSSSGIPHRPSQQRLVVRMERHAATVAVASEGRKGKQREKNQEVAMEEEEEDEEEEEKRKRASTTIVLGRKGSNSGQTPCCQAENCCADLITAKRYHRRHKVCETHSKAAIVMVAGLRQRFCQQCSRFHEISEFDESKRSCRRRLAGHNERRRKNSVDSQTDGTSRRGIGHQLKDNHCRPSEEAGRMQITLQGNRTCKHFQIR